MSVCRIRLSFSWSGKKKGMHSTTYTLPCVIPYSITKIHSVLDFKKNKSLKQTLHNRKFKTFCFICQDLFFNFSFLKALVFWDFYIISSCDIISFFAYVCMLILPITLFFVVFLMHFLHLFIFHSYKF